MNKDKEPVIVFENVSDTVQIDDIYQFPAYLTLGLSSGNDFYLNIDFKNLAKEEYETLAKLSQLPRSLKFSSKLIEKENYNITHIVVVQFKMNNLLEMNWECLSDNPEKYNLIIGQ